MLTQSDVAYYLLSLGVVKPRAVVDDELVVADASRRNCVFIAGTRVGPAYVVKQAGPRSAPTLAHEAAVLGALADVPDLAELVPSTAAGARNWSEHHASGAFPLAPARVLGRALAAVHRLPADSVEDLPPGFDPLWGLSLPELPHEVLLDLSATAVDLVARLQAGEFVCSRLREVQSAGSDGALAHGDLRWENCLLAAPPGGRRRTRVLLVDWELAGSGPSGLDVGTVIAEYLCRWVGSIPIPEPHHPDRFVDRAGYPLRLMRPAIQAFWSAYRSASGRPPALARVIELAGVRLLQAAVERAQDMAALSAQVVVLVQLADNLLRDPEGAALALLGLD